MSRYAAAHIEPQGAGDPRPTALQIVHDEKMKNNLVRKVAIVTGTSSGIGIEIVRALAATGVTLYLTARDPDKAKAALGDSFNPKQMELIKMDQTSLESVRNAANTILSKTTSVNILINNAGIMALPDLQFTTDGYEVQFATNHLSHFLLFQLLCPALLSASTPDFHSRVVMVSASGHRIHGINSSDNYHFQKGGYDPWNAYAQSKTANIYMANEIERRYGSQGLHATSSHPGLVATPIGKYLPTQHVEAMMQNKALLKILKSPEQGAATIIWAAIGREWEGIGGKYLADCAEAERGPDDGQRNMEGFSGYGELKDR
ncbi:hypothetical protein EYZ11_010865 [Aspergillus tanneri]|uniref:WW domain-containing oxidoreductase n=1 Tax=Aspergillus tanneri TaxID=1220188 RepID=A0A4S3J4C4_9EURO|nr:hypothetical protein EYZ11_010865 [Aspergillus tanneri]